MSSMAAGTRIGPYEIVAPLGSGGMGEVWRARDTRLSRDVAIKALPVAFAGDAERLSRFRREAQTLAALNHPNIAAIYGLEEVEGRPHLVLELVEGETLAARLARGTPAPRDALRLCEQIAAAIEAAHERGIVHRDLKPGNAMVTASGVVKVLDFGLAKSDPVLLAESDSSALATRTAFGEPTRVGSLLGTVAYMSPEQARGKPVDRRSDVWSFGCVLFECLSGKPPFRGETPSDLIAAILEREPDWSELPSATPARVRELLRRSLRKDAEARPRDIRDVRIELAEVLAGGGTREASGEQSIAVLPFENLSGADDEYFSDGVTDEILSRLSHLEGLRVAARTSCFAFKGKRDDLRAIGEQLDVASVLEGSVRRSGARLRITVQLVRAADGRALWSERYDREMTDVFEVQDEIANAIATRLRGTLQDEAARSRARRSTNNLEAYELFLKGRAFQNRRGRFLPQAIECFEKAVALDPRFAEAMAWLSDSYRLMGTFGTAPFGTVMERARQLGKQALAIDPELAEAWAALACIAEHYDWDFAGALPLWERALALDPRHSRARCQRAQWCMSSGMMAPDVALVEVKRGVEDDPLNAWVVAMSSHLHGMLDFHDESVAGAERAFQLDPESFFAHWNLMRAYAWAGLYDRAFETAPSLLTAAGRHPWALGVLGWTFGAAGKLEQARAVHDEMEARSRYEFMPPFWIAVVASMAEMNEAAKAAFERAVREHDPLVVWSRRTPFCRAIRANPWFTEIARGVWKES